MNGVLTRSAIHSTNSESICPPGGHYAHVCTAAGVVYISGQLPIEPDGTPMTGQSFEMQVRRVLTNIDSCLACVGLDTNSLVQVRVYLTDIKNWPQFNQMYAEWLGNHRPARAVAGVSELHFGLEVEVESVALARDSLMASPNSPTRGHPKFPQAAQPKLGTP
ncbi:MAG: RidA family protein [Limnohabitans sp.]|nr:RidA family protein [Limnohabitans sp.]